MTDAPQITTADGTFSGYLARPAAGHGPGLVIIQEIFGVNGFVRDIADQWAARGYVAFAPDLFWRIEPNIQLTDQTEAEWARAFELYNAFDVEGGVQDIAASIAYLRSRNFVANKIGCIGFCLGGLLAYLTAARTDCNASVAYYGVGIENKINEVSAINKPLLMHIAACDKYVSREAQATIHAAIADNAQISSHTYENCDHAFARVGGAHFNASAAQLADQRTLDFLNVTLRD